MVIVQGQEVVTVRHYLLEFNYQNLRWRSERLLSLTDC